MPHTPRSDKVSTHLPIHSHAVASPRIDARTLDVQWGMGWVDDTGAPHVKGCNEYFGVLDQNYAHNMYPFLANYTWQYPASDGSLKYESISYPNNANASREYCMSAGNNCTWSHDLWTNAALAFLERQAVIQAEARARGEAAQPFFLYLAYTDPHAGGWTGTDELGNPVPSDGIFGNASLTWPDPERDHASVIQNFQDRDVGRVVDALEKGGIRDSTAVFFASDNGASNEGNHDYAFFGSSGPLRGFKRCLTEGGIRTAFAVSWPGTIPANVTTNYTVAFWDMMPTIAEMAGIPNSALPNDIDGISVWPAIMGNSDAPVHPPLYWEFCTAVHPPGTIKQNATAVGWGHAVRMGKWKGVSLFWGEPLSLYNLETDIGELNDVSADHADIVAEMAAYAKSAHVDSVYFPTGDDCASS